MLLISTISVDELKAQHGTRFHAVFLYQFTKYLEWPNEPNEFNIGVLGESEIIDELNRMAELKSSSSVKYTVTKYTSVSQMVRNSNIIYIPNVATNQVGTVMTAIPPKGVLVITEKEGVADKGGHVNLVFEEGRLIMEVAKEKMDAAGFQMSNQLKRFAKII